MSSCGDVICKQMDEHNQLPLPSDTSTHFVQSIGYCNMTLCDMVVNDRRFFEVRSWTSGKKTTWLLRVTVF